MDRKELRTPNAPSPRGAYSQGIQALAGSMCFTAGQLGKDPKTGRLLPDIAGQTRQALENIRSILAEAGAETGDIVKATVHLKNLDDFDRFNEAYAAFFAEHAPNQPLPARTTVESGLGGGALVEIDTIAVKAPAP